MARPKKQYPQQRYKYYVYTIDYRTGKEQYSKRAYLSSEKALQKCKTLAHTNSDNVQPGYHGYTQCSKTGIPKKYFGICDVYVD